METEQEEQEPTALDNYQELLPGGVRDAAVFGDMEFAEMGLEEGEILPGVELQTDDLMARSHHFHDMMTGYVINTKAITGNDPSLDSRAYRSMKKQADGYLRDAALISAADASYANFVPTANTASREMARTMMIQDLLPEIGRMKDLKSGIKAHAKGLKAAAKVASPETGTVEVAMNRLESAASAGRSAVQDFQALLIRGTAKPKEKAQGSSAARESLDQLAVEKKYDEFEAKERKTIALEKKTMALTKYALKALSFVPGAGVVFGAVSGGLPEGSKSVADPLDVAHKEGDGSVAQIHQEMQGLVVEMEALGLLVDQKQAMAITERFANAQRTYEDAWREVQNAVANQRTAYARLGATADDKEAEKQPKKKVGKSPDDASQLMLYIAAVREANQVTSMAVTDGARAKDDLYEAKESIDSHTGPGHHWIGGVGEGQKTEYGPDGVRDAVKAALKLTAGWLRDNKKAAKELAQLEKEANRALDSVGLDGDF